MKASVVLGLLAALIVNAQAQTIYRCGADGRSYSQTPCSGGAAVDASDARSDRERREARAVAEADQALADRMERDRLQAEARFPRRATIIGERKETIAPHTSSKSHLQKMSRAKKSKRAQDDRDFTALAPKQKTP